MKNIFKIAPVAILALTATSAFAQEDNASTTLNVNVGSLYEITVAQATVEINMNTAAHFQSGNNSGAQANHIQVSATGQYEVSVIASQDLTNDAETIPVSTVTVSATLGDYLGGGDDPGDPGDITYTDVSLDTVNEATIIDAASGESLRGFNVTYTIPEESASQYLNHTAGAYTTLVTYSLYAQ